MNQPMEVEMVVSFLVPPAPDEYESIIKYLRSVCGARVEQIRETDGQWFDVGASGEIVARDA